MDVYNIKRAEMYEDIQRREQEIKEEFVQKVKEKEIEKEEKNWKQLIIVKLYIL